ncbi:MAG: hypothetical protein IT436_17310 [Phycisphaerales bacterium]|nr:hypothetical protein [Phycisphaerales bacterium]
MSKEGTTIATSTDAATLADQIIASFVIKDTTARAVLRAIRLADDEGAARAMPDHIRRACRECRARIGPTAAALGWLRDIHDGRWVDATSDDPGPDDALPPCGDAGDLESRACLLVFALIGDAVRCSVALPMRAAG